MKNNTIKYNKIRVFLLLSILLLIILITLHKLNIININNIYNSYFNNTKEGFTVPTTGYYFGNCFYSTDNISSSGENIILNFTQDKPQIELNLTNEMKLLGFEIDKYSGGTNDGDLNKYSISVGNTNDDMKRVINLSNYYKFEFGTNKNNDLSLFEDEDGISKYTGTRILIKLENIPEDIGNYDFNIKVNLFGLDAYAPKYSELTENYPTSTLTSSEYDSSNKKIYFSTGDNSTANKKILAIKIPNYTNITNKILKVRYSNTYDGNTRKYVAKGPIQQGFDVRKNNIVYFNKPIIANTIYFNDNISLTNGSDIIIYSAVVSSRDEINFKLKTGVDDKATKFNIDGEKCPSTSQMLQKQLQAQQICEALEYKDRIKNAKSVYEKEKEYLKKLALQEKELKELENTVNKLISRKNERVSKNQYYNVEQLDKELRKIEETRKQAENDLLETKKAHELKIDLNLDPQYSDILKKYEKTGILN
jgi:hypothetical protein